MLTLKDVNSVSISTHTCICHLHTRGTTFYFYLYLPDICLRLSVICGECGENP